MSSESNKEIQYSIFKRYFEGKASKEENQIVYQWLVKAERSFKVENYLRLLWKETDPDARQPDIDLNLLLDKIHHAINLKSRKENIRSLPIISKPVVSFTYVLRNVARIAAILLLPLLGYLSWEIYSQKMWMNSQATVVYNEIICPMGVRSQFELPDGTRGNLNNGSRLKYPVKFSGNTREVELIGEAFFDVLHDKKRPFIINTAGLDVKVLGTMLNIYSYPEEGYQEITVESGTVELIKRENNQEIYVAIMKSGQHLVYGFKDDITETNQICFDKEPIIINDRKELNEFISEINPGQCAVYEMNSGNADAIIDELEYYSAWKDGKLVLRNDPMPRLLKRIERWYNVKFNILDENIKEYTYWATFEEENVQQVLNLLSLTGPISFKQHPREKTAHGTYKIQEIDIMLKKQQP